MDTEQREQLRQWGIRKGVGHHRRTCPNCSDSRAKKRDQVLSVTHDGEKILWRCWHCEDQGAIRIEQTAVFMKPVYQQPKPVEKGAVREIGTMLDPLAISFLKGRGLSIDTANLYGLTFAVAYFPALKRVTSALAMPYARGKKDHPYKLRSTEDKAHVCKNTPSSLFGLELVDLKESGDLIICEGELDALAMREAGVLNATSVPNGASSFTNTGETDAKATMSFLWSAKEKIDQAKRIVIAVDMDEPGDKLAEELARRVGRHRCWRVQFPCKDANDVLLTRGKQELVRCVEQAEPWPVEGLYEATRFIPEVLQLYEDGVGERILTGMSPVDELYSCAPGLLTIVTGIPGHGKSTFVDQIMVNQARTYGNTFAICSFENPIPVHMAKLSEMLLQKHFFDSELGYKMSRQELESVQPFIARHFKFLNQDDGQKATLDSIIERIKTAVFRYGINAAVIDPYNYIARPAKADSETVWIDDMLTRLKLLAQSSGIHIWFIAHPTKLPMDSEGNYTPPRGYSISGSAAWYSKADFGLTVHRVPDRPGLVEVICWKCRFDWLGKEGKVGILYDTQTNVYLADAVADLPPMSYREAKRGDDGEEEYRFH